jgi:RHS repeat-associated protein
VVGQSVYNYDTAGNVQRIRHQNAAGTTNLLDLNSTYDSADRLTSETDNGTTTTYGYDFASQVTQAGSTGYSYDPNGNRNNSGFVPGADNLLQTATIGGVTWNYTYDLENNRIKATQGTSAPTWTYTYNLANQMTSAEERAMDGGTVLVHVNFAYDVYGQLVQTAVTVGAGGVTNYARARGQVWADLDGSAGNALKVRYLTGDGTDQWLARLVSAGYANAGLTFYLTDRQGSVRGLTDNTGVLQDQINYDAFGNISETTPTVGDSHKYAGYQYETTVGLYYARARWYDPGTGRWTTEDPDGFGAGDVNLQRYVGNSPSNAVDSSGTITNWKGWEFAGALDRALGIKTGVEVTYADGTTGSWAITTAGELRTILNGAISSGNKIAQLKIYSHGTPTEMLFNNSETNPESLNARVGVISDTNGNVTPLFQNALTKNASIDLLGCNTADGPDSMAKSMSIILPGKKVTGGTGAQARFFAPTAVMGFTKTYKNGKEFDEDEVRRAGNRAERQKMIEGLTSQPIAIKYDKQGNKHFDYHPYPGGYVNSRGESIPDPNDPIQRYKRMDELTEMEKTPKGLTPEQKEQLKWLREWSRWYNSPQR